MKKALITGISGQDGSYLAELLIDKNYEVHGVLRKSSSFNTGRINHLYEDEEILNQKLFLHYGDLIDPSSLHRLLEKVEPDEIYNLAAQSHVKVSFDIPDYTAQVGALGCLRFLDAIRETGGLGQVRFYQASTSEMFGRVAETPQSEKTPFYPRSPYGVAKLYAYWIVVNYREAYGLFASNGILFNHESPRRGNTFVTKKITREIARMINGRSKKLVLGNLEALRDWGYAPEYCEGMWRILQYSAPDDFVLATGKSHSVREFVEECFAYIGIELEWQGTGMDERGFAASIVAEQFRESTGITNSFIYQGDILVEVSSSYFRPTEVDRLVGDASKAKRELGWEPTITFRELTRLMIEGDLKVERRALTLEASK